MALQYGITLKNNRLDQIEVTAGTAAILKILSGGAPATPATADSGSTLVTMVLPVDWMSNASAGVKTKLGTWQVSAVGAGSMGYFRIYDSASAACHVQGLVSQATASGELIVDNSVVASGQVVTVNIATITAGN